MKTYDILVGYEAKSTAKQKHTHINDIEILVSNIDYLNLKG